jgi:hypothetical protein
MRRYRALFMPLAASCRRHFSANFITNISEFDFRQAQVVELEDANGLYEALHDYTRPGGVRESVSSSSTETRLEQIDFSNKLASHLV